MRFPADHAEQWRPFAAGCMVSDLGRAATQLSGSVAKAGRRFSLMRDGRTYYRFQRALMRLVAVPEGRWVSLPGFPRYLINDVGDVARLLSLADNGNGYLYLRADRRAVGVHRAVCRAFHGASPAPKLDAAHEDRDTTNNHACNLRWATRTENMADARGHGTLAPWRKLSPEQVLDIRRRRAAGENRERLADEFGVTGGTIYRIASGRRHTYLPMAA